MYLSCPYTLASLTTALDAEGIDDGIGNHAMAHCIVRTSCTVKIQKHIGHLVRTIAEYVACSLFNPAVTRSQ